MTDAISLITATGGRPEAFKLLEGYIAHQRYRGSIEWIVVDDCQPETPCTMGQQLIIPDRLWQQGQNTQARNMQLALNAVTHDKILIIEDDEYYAPDYLTIMSSILDYVDMAGEGWALYYNVKLRRYHRHLNDKHACFARTGFTTNIMMWIKKRLRQYELEQKFNRTDVRMWQDSGPIKKYIYLDAMPLSIGIKGMPGRAAINGQHDSVSVRYLSDMNLEYLTSIIGSDAENYRGYLLK